MDDSGLYRLVHIGKLSHRRVCASGLMLESANRLRDRFYILFPDADYIIEPNEMFDQPLETAWLWRKINRGASDDP